jgi:hypothetical protein
MLTGRLVEMMLCQWNMKHSIFLYPTSDGKQKTNADASQRGDKDVQIFFRYSPISTSRNMPRTYEGMTKPATEALRLNMMK